MTFYGQRSAATHPNTFPSTPRNGSFSPLVGFSHEDAYTMWDAGMLASKGIRAVAETGELFILQTNLRVLTFYTNSPGGNRGGRKDRYEYFQIN